MAAIYRDLAADQNRNAQVVKDVTSALADRRHCLVLVRRKDHVERLAEMMKEHVPVILVGGMGVKARAAAMAHLQPGAKPLLLIATGSFVGEGLDCPALDTVFLAAPVSFKGRLVQHVGRVLRAHPGKATAEVCDYLDDATPVLARALERRSPGYLSLGFPDQRKMR